MNRWHRLLDGWLVGAVLLLAALLVLVSCGPVPPPRPVLPTVKPLVTFEPVCTRQDGRTMGWTTSLKVNGAYRTKIFNGPYPPIIDYRYPVKGPLFPGGDPNRVYVLTTALPWVLEYTSDPTRFPWVEVSARITTKPPVICSI